MAVRRRAPEPPSLGYLFGEPGELTYFPGDTALFEGMSEIAAAASIWRCCRSGAGGRRWAPGTWIPGRRRRRWRVLAARRAVPIHWGTYTPIGAGRLWPWMSERPARDFAAQPPSVAAGAEVTILEPGESLPAFGA